MAGELLALLAQGHLTTAVDGKLKRNHNVRFAGHGTVRLHLAHQNDIWVERFFRTTLDECLYVQSFLSDQERAAALEAFVCYYNATRPHLALRGLTPLQRLAQELALLPTS